jgi:hydrophobic/amphiphilic exporter-1 (mainly G- bacteria), HAE1 family
MIPMMRAEGPSAQGNHSISIAAAGGMVSGVILGLFIIPVLFIVFQALQEAIRPKPAIHLPTNNHHEKAYSEPALALDYNN